MPAALLLVDIQYSFLPLGELGVAGGDEILDPVYQLLDEGEWSMVVASQDYHPASHISFASRHGRKAFTSIRVPRSSGDDVLQELWPDHCVQGTKGAELEAGIKQRLDRLGGKIIRKGTDKDVDAYSAFAPLETGSGTTSEVTALLLEHHITELYIVGLATDYCVRASTLSALKASAELEEGKGWEVFVVRDAVRGVDPDKSKQVLQELTKAGAKVVSMQDEAVRRCLHAKES